MHCHSRFDGIVIVMSYLPLLWTLFLEIKLSLSVFCRHRRRRRRRRRSCGFRPLFASTRLSR